MRRRRGSAGDACARTGRTRACRRDRAGDRASGDAGERDAVAAEALDVEEVRIERAEIRRAVARDVDEAAPRMVDAHVAELREHADHAAPDRFGERGGRRAGRIRAAAEQHPVVGRQPEIVEEEVVVAHGFAARSARRRAPAERLGRDDGRRDRRDAGGRRGRQHAAGPRCSTTRRSGSARRRRRAHDGPLAAHDVERRRMRVQRDAFAARGIGYRGST